MTAFRGEKNLIIYMHALFIQIVYWYKYRTTGLKKILLYLFYFIFILFPDWWRQDPVIEGVGAV